MRLSVLISCIIIMLLFTITGCVPWYCCGYHYYSYTCIKGDTTGSYINGPQSTLANAINSYEAQGFVCTSTDMGLSAWNCERGNIERNRALREGQECTGSDDENCSPSGQQCGP